MEFGGFGEPRGVFSEDSLIEDSDEAEHPINTSNNRNKVVSTPNGWIFMFYTPKVRIRLIYAKMRIPPKKVFVNRKASRYNQPMASVKKQSRTLLSSTNASITNPRLILLGLLLREARPLTIDQVLKLTKGKLAQSTLYRVINDLRNFGLLSVFTNLENTMVIELNDQASSHHHHVFCRKCGSITDIELNPELELKLDVEVKRIEKEHHILIDGHSLELFATCKSCSGEEASKV